MEYLVKTMQIPLKPAGTVRIPEVLIASSANASVRELTPSKPVVRKGLVMAAKDPLSPGRSASKGYDLW